MPLGTDYTGQDCALARTLEIVGERWTLLVLRDCMFGVRRFTDLLSRLEISRAVLADRLAELVSAGLIERHEYRPKRDEYVVTDKGVALWPALYALMQWGETFTASAGRRRIFVHLACDAEIDSAGRCPGCAGTPGPAELEMRPGPALTGIRSDPVSRALQHPHRLLTPIR